MKLIIFLILNILLINCEEKDSEEQFQEKLKKFIEERKGYHEEKMKKIDQEQREYLINKKLDEIKAKDSIQPTEVFTSDYLSQLHIQLSEWPEDYLTTEMIDKFWNNNPKYKFDTQYTRIQIKENKVYYKSYLENCTIYFSYQKSLLNTLVLMTEIYELPEVDFILLTQDHIVKAEACGNVSCDPFYHTPFFMMSKDLGNPLERKALLFPDAYMLGQREKWKQLKTQLKEEREQADFDKKESKMFFRGAPNGNPNNEYGYNRIKLAYQSVLYPQIIDAKFNPKTETKYEFYWANTNESFISEIEHLKYKYLISYDGGTCSWMRVPWIIYSSSLLVKAVTQRIEWFYHKLVPYVNYIPLREDLNDVLTQFQWMEQNPNKVKQIIKNANQLAEHEFDVHSIYEYIYKILKGYQRIQKFKQVDIVYCEWVYQTIHPPFDMIQYEYKIEQKKQQIRNICFQDYLLYILLAIFLFEILVTIIMIKMYLKTKKSNSLLKKL